MPSAFSTINKARSHHTWNRDLAVNVLADDVDVVSEHRTDWNDRRFICHGASHKLPYLLVLHHRLIMLHQVHLARCGTEKIEEPWEGYIARMRL